ncbi:hypothetical protein GOBAR_DD04304 [Gossypium barbadense]|nr:hypothetical protein GOBAR_DD04304 [Gossypium barbadense]
MMPVSGYMDSNPHLRNQAPYPPHYFPGFEAVPPHFKADPSKSPLMYESWPCSGNCSRCAMEDDILPDGHKVRKGDGVYYMAYAMGRMSTLWGEDAHCFRPERWLHNGVFRPESPFKFVAFHAGPRICLGKDFAYRQMKIVSIAVLRHFRLKLVDDAKAVNYRTMFTLHMKEGLHLYAVPRTIM